MFDWLYHRVPESVRLPLDIISASTAISAVFGALTGVVGFVGATAAMVYAVARAYYYIKDKRAGK